VYLGNVAMFLIVFAIQKYHPDRFSAGKLLSTLSPLLPSEALMISPERKILGLSKGKLFLNGFSYEDLEGTGFEKLFINGALIEEEMEKIKKNPNYSASFETRCRMRNGDVVNLRIGMSGLRNEFNDVISYLLVFNKIAANTNLLQFLQSSYELSDREKEVAALLLNECSNT
jgi:hypothetical protein